MGNDVIDHVCRATAAASALPVHGHGEERLALTLPLAVIAARLRCRAALVGFSFAALLANANNVASD